MVQGYLFRENTSNLQPISNAIGLFNDCFDLLMRCAGLEMAKRALEGVSEQAVRSTDVLLWVNFSLNFFY